MPSARAPMPAPQMIETPAMRRSALLAKMLEQQRQPTEIKGGYGELGARLLAQGITQWSANRAEKAVRSERDQRFEGQAGGINEMLAGLLARSGRGEVQAPPATTPMPNAMPEPSATAPTAPAAPVGEVMGSPLPSPGQPVPLADVPPAAPVPASPAPVPMPAAEGAPVPAPQMAAPVAPSAPQAAPNALGITPGEQARIARIVALAQTTRDPALLAYARSELDLIDQRMNAAPEWEDVSVNGIPFLRDQFGNMREAFPDGLPESVMTQDEFNPRGTRSGTFGQRDRFGNLNLIESPPVGFEATGEGGRLQPIRGGPNDPRTGENRIRNERELRREYEGATQEYRTVRQAFQKVEASLAQGTGIGDVGGIFGVMKIFDPGSTVREGEAATVQNSGGVPETIRGLYNRVVTGERLTPAQRAEIVAVGRAQFGTYEQGYQSRVTDFTRMANDYGIDPRNIVGADEAPAPAPSGERLTPQQAAALPAGTKFLDMNGVERTRR